MAAYKPFIIMYMPHKSHGTRTKQGYVAKLKTYSTIGDSGLEYKYSKGIKLNLKYKTSDESETSAKMIYKIFIEKIEESKEYWMYIDDNKISKKLIKLFIKIDICRKFLQMGFIKSMKQYYRNSDVKWKFKNTNINWDLLPNEYKIDQRKSGETFKYYLDKINTNKIYQELQDYFNHLPLDARQIENV